MRKTKIVCTLGPASESEDMIRQLMLEGMNVARFNFSHGSHEEHTRKFDRVKKVREELGLPVATMLDTKGPEIRLRDFKDHEKILLKAGQTFTLTTNEIEGTAERVSISYKDLVKDIEVGARVLIDDGLVEMKVLNVTDTDITCRVMNDGYVSDKKGVNVPGTDLSMPYISEKDYSDIVFGIETGFDFIAASFVRNAEDILQIRKIFQEKGCNTINIIAKIENMQGVENIDEIIRVSDGIMVARGDMGVEIPMEDVPIVQKMIIHKVYNAGKQVITATQMLDSMMKNPRPTRAEATDVANAIYDGTSAIMLSGETAAGQYPVEAVRTMVKIAERTEEAIDYEGLLRKREVSENPDVTNAISHATCTTAADMNASAIITVTKSGQTARMLSKYRPACPIVGCSPYENVCRQMNLSWGVYPYQIQMKTSTEELFDAAVDAAMKGGIVKQGELTVITAGVPLGITGTTNMIKVHVAGHILLTGKGLSNKKATAGLCVVDEDTNIQDVYKTGDIIVVSETTNDMLPQIKTCSGIIVEQGGINSHAAIVGLSLDIPVILDAKYATSILKTGAVVTIDSEKGIVSC